MNTTTMPSSPTAQKDWDDARIAFASSIMVDTSLSSLAQNLDGLEWPLRGSDETPSAYIDLTYNEVLQMLTARGQPEAVPVLTRILRETLAFDEPFGEMVKQTEETARRENPLLRALARLSIPENFPLELTAIDEGARELCRLEHLETLGQFALFAQGLSQSVIVGGDFRSLLNALSHLDEQALAQLLPFRAGTTGLHLAETLAHAASATVPPQRTSQAIHWFSNEFAQWKKAYVESPASLARQLSHLNKPELEQRIIAQLTPHLPSRARRGWIAALRQAFTS
jgi:hypothetical protein